METKVCKCCGRELPIVEFRQTKIGRVNTCNECITKHQIKAKADKKMRKMEGEESEKAKRARLADFTPRELMEELKRRGYEGTLTYTETRTIDLARL